MSSLGPNSPGTLADDATVGTVAWTNPTNAGASDDVYATVGTGFGGGQWLENTIKLVVGGTVSGNNKSTGAIPTSSDVYVSYGSSSDLWGLTLSSTDINASDFGVVLSYVSNGDFVVTSHYLKATNFGFSIPTGATIDGVLAEIEQKSITMTGASIAYIDHIRITVYYTETGTMTGVQSMTGVSSIII